MLLDQVSIHSWINNNQIKTESGTPIDFTTHRYLFDIYRDNSKYLCCLKAGQIGFSTMAILKTLWLAKNRNINIGYILPTVDMVEKFVGSKVNRMAQNNDIIGQWMKDKDKISEKQIGDAYIFYLGAQTERSAIMLTLDMLVADEYDKAPQNILEIYDSRLQHSKHGYKWVFSNPTAPDFGSDKFWKISDQKKWFIKHSCGEEYILNESCIDYIQEKYICPECGEEITDEERRKGEWKATARGEWSGYWIPLWINPMVPAKKIAEYKRTKSAQYFANFVAGMPYMGSGDTVQASTIISCLSLKTNPQDGRVIIGVDTGLPTHYVLANKHGFFHYDTCSDPSTGKDPYKELEALLARFPGSIIVSDQGGDLSGMRVLQARFPGRVFLVWYRKDRKTQELITWGEGAKYGEVYADRNQLMQLFIDEMRDKRTVFNGTEAEWQDYITHWLNIYRVWETDEAGLVDKTKGFKWERQGPDHWVHATMYARIGLDKFAENRGKVVSMDTFGFTTGSSDTGDITGRQLFEL